MDTEKNGAHAPGTWQASQAGRDAPARNAPARTADGQGTGGGEVVQAPPGRRAARRRWLRPAPLLLGLTVLLAGLAAAHAMLWHWMGGRLEEGFTAWAQSRRAQGWRVEYGTPQRGGWPFSATLRLPDFRLSGGDATLPGGIDWRVPALDLRVVLPRLDELRIEPKGPQRLRLGALELPFAADRLTGLLPLQADVLPRGGEFRADRLRLGLPGTAADGGPGGLEIRRLEVTLDTRSSATEGESAIALSVQSQGITLPSLSQGRSWPLGPRIETAGLTASLTGPLPVGRVPTRRAEIWRDAGGVLELRDVTLRWGPTAASAAATLALDEALQPMGAGTVRLVGAQEALSMLGAGGVIDARTAETASRMAALLARPGGEGEPPQIELPLTLQDRRLSLARLPVLRLPELVWPVPPGRRDSEE